ncbi:MAG: RNA polymerase sigma factor, partial [Planctomycetota bacterium]
MDFASPDAAAAASHPVTDASPDPAAERDAEALLAAYVKGDEAAFETLFDQVGHRIFAFVLRMMADSHRAEDVYQTVLIKVATKADLYRKKASVVAWLFQIARNACLDALR